MTGVILSFLAGGIVGLALKEKILGKSRSEQQLRQQMESLYAENSQLSNQHREAVRRAEDLEAEVSRLRRAANTSEERHDDLEDERDRYRRELQRAQSQLEEVSRQLKECQIACETQRYELESYKKQGQA